VVAILDLPTQTRFYGEEAFMDVKEKMVCCAAGKTNGSPLMNSTGVGDEQALNFSEKRKAVKQIYRSQGFFVTQFVFWKMKIDPMFMAVDGVIPPQGEVLDLGCGYGMVSHWITRFAPKRRVLGVDFDAKRIRVAKATTPVNPRAIFEKQNVLEWPEYPPCDCVLLCDMLHYLPCEAKAEVLRKAFRALRPGGLVVLRDACSDKSRPHRIVEWTEKWAVRLGHTKSAHGLHFDSMATHLSLLAEAGFVQSRTVLEAQLWSNVMLVATKPAC
jgi:2-polyprenyl-3-methyl-5-hydroxy-6-metoxy-1,4-benzoquinol methylase